MITPPLKLNEAGVWVVDVQDEDPAVNRALADADAMIRTRNEIRSLPTTSERS